MLAVALLIIGSALVVAGSALAWGVAGGLIAGGLVACAWGWDLAGRDGDVQ